jgi:hypothetical protein
MFKTATKHCKGTYENLLGTNRELENPVYEVEL